MIASPCTQCIKKSRPKDKCAKDCEVLKILQEIEVSRRDCIFSAIDYSDEGRFVVNSKESF